MVVRLGSVILFIMLNTLEAASVLSHSLIFHGIDLPALENLAECGKLVRFESKSVIVQENDSKNRALNVIVEGSVQILKSGSAKVTQLGRGNFFGEISLFSMGTAATATVTAPQGATIFSVGRLELEKWFKRFSNAEILFFRHLSTELCHRLNATTEKLGASLES